MSSLSTEQILTLIETRIEARNQNTLELIGALAGMLGSRIGKYALPFLTTISGFWLWNRALDNPSTSQLIALGLYGAFIEIPILWLTLRGK